LHQCLVAASSGPKPRIVPDECGMQVLVFAKHNWQSICKQVKTFEPVKTAKVQNVSLASKALTIQGWILRDVSYKERRPHHANVHPLAFANDRG